MIKKKLAIAVLTSATTVAQQPSQKPELEVTTGANILAYDTIRGSEPCKGIMVSPQFFLSYGKLNVSIPFAVYTKANNAGNNHIGPGEFGSMIASVDYMVLDKTKFSTSLGYELDSFPAFGTNISHGLRANVTLKRMPFDATVLGVYDFDKGKGWYFEPTVEKKFGPFLFRETLGFDIHYFRRESGFMYAESRVSMPFKMNGIGFEPNVSYMYASNQKTLDEKNMYYKGLNGGVNIRFSIKKPSKK